MRLKEFREKKKLTQQKVADYLNISRGAYCNIENEKRDPDTQTLSKLARLFETTTDELLGEVVHEKTAAHADGGVDEQELLTLFRQLSHDKKEYVRGVLEGLSAAHKQ